MFSSPAKFISLLIICLLLILLLFACSTYNRRIEVYYQSFYSGNYEKANLQIDRVKVLKKNRNQLLYFMEKGRVCHLLGRYEMSNRYFNLADNFIEEARTNAGDIVTGTFVNPMMQKYLGEDFEKFMIHYYKALNYLYLKQTEEAVVEARRISLQSQRQENRFNDQNRRYSKDAFSLMLQGLIYESAGDVNNAFIAYRNAAEVYLREPNWTYYGVELPRQLKDDLLRTAYLNGFTDELGRFEKIFNMKYSHEQPAEGGYFVFFWENGSCPVKEQQEFFFVLSRNADGLYFREQSSGTMIPFHSSLLLSDHNFDLLHLSVFRVAFPRYNLRPPNYNYLNLSNGSQKHFPERAEDINELALATLKQRFVKDLSLALSRMAVKKAAEFAIRGSNKNRKHKELREGIAGAIQIYNVLSEKADTRNWQTLPSSISYVRVPLSKGMNNLTITSGDFSGRQEVKSIQVEATGGLVFYNYSTP